MGSMSPVQSSMLFEKQKSLLAVFTTLLETYKIKLEIDPVEFEIQSPYSLDVEHDEQGNMVCIGVYDGVKALCFTYIPSLLLRQLLGSSIIAHNGISDMECLRSWGIPVSDTQLIHDTMLVGHVLDSSLKSYGLKDMAKRELGIEYPDYDMIVGKKTKKQSVLRVTLDQQPIDLVSMYNACDCWATYQLYLKQKAEIDRVSQ